MKNIFWAVILIGVFFVTSPVMANQDVYNSLQSTLILVGEYTGNKNYDTDAHAWRLEYKVITILQNSNNSNPIYFITHFFSMDCKPGRIITVRGIVDWNKENAEKTEINSRWILFLENKYNIKYNKYADYPGSYHSLRIPASQNNMDKIKKEMEIKKNLYSKSCDQLSKLWKDNYKKLDKSCSNDSDCMKRPSADCGRDCINNINANNAAIEEMCWKLDGARIDKGCIPQGECSPYITECKCVDKQCSAIEKKP